MIAIASSHYYVAKKQAYAVRDELLRLDIESSHLYQKSAWLSVYAKALQYKDWGEFSSRTKYAHTECTNTLIITPETVTPLARRLYAFLGTADAAPELLVDILRLCVTNEENALFSDKKPERLEVSDVITLELGPSSRYSVALLSWLFEHSAFQDELAMSWVEDAYLEHMKQLRKTVDKSEVGYRSLDVYKKRGKPIGTIVSDLQEAGYIEFSENAVFVRVTYKGRWWVRSYMSDDYSSEWQSWWSEWLSLWEKVPYKPMPCNLDHFLVDYSEGLSAKDSVTNHGWMQCSVNRNTEFREQVKRRLGLDLKQYPEERIFAVIPRLYVTPNLIRLPAKDVCCELKGPEWLQQAFENRCIKPYPNKRYIRLGKEKCLLAVVPEDIKQVTFTLLWTSISNAFPPIEHHFTVELEEDDKLPNNWLYMVPRECYSMNASYCLTCGEDLQQEELLELPRVKEGLVRAEFSRESVSLTDEVSVKATNPYAHYIM